MTSIKGSDTVLYDSCRKSFIFMKIKIFEIANEERTDPVAYRDCRTWVVSRLCIIFSFSVILQQCTNN